MTKYEVFAEHQKTNKNQVRQTGNYYYGARYYNPKWNVWLSVDPLVEETMDAYGYCYHNPINFVDPTGMSAEDNDDIIIKGENNSSITIVTDLIDIEIDASSIVGDLGGNFTLEGEEILVAALDIVGVLDPTGAADIAAGSIEMKNGNIWGGLASYAGFLPLLGDLGKVGKTKKHLNTIENAIEGLRTAENTAATSRAARRSVMRKEGIPTSQQPISQSKNSSGREYSYKVPKKGGGTQRKSVQQQTMDRNHDQPHWEGGEVRTDNGKTRMNNYNRPKLVNKKSKVNY
jgi:RHS repeat-associated protein